MNAGWRLHSTSVPQVCGYLAAASRPELRQAPSPLNGWTAYGTRLPRLLYQGQAHHIGPGLLHASVSAEPPRDPVLMSIDLRRAIF